MNWLYEHLEVLTAVLVLAIFAIFFNIATSEKIELIKSEWTCAHTRFVGGKVFVCDEYLRK